MIYKKWRFNSICLQFKILLIYFKAVGIFNYLYQFYIMPSQYLLTERHIFLPMQCTIILLNILLCFITIFSVTNLGRKQGSYKDSFSFEISFAFQNWLCISAIVLKFPVN